MKILVAVPVPALDLLTYCVPDGMTPPPVGARVVVPLGTRTVTGIVVDRVDRGAASATTADIKPIRQVLDDEAFLPADVVALARWTAEYYAAGPGDTIMAVLPPKTRGERADSHKTIRVASITAAGSEAIESGLSGPHAPVDGPSKLGPYAARPAITAKQREALDILAGAPAGLPTAQLTARGIGSDTVARLVRHGFASVRQARVDRDPFEAAPFAATMAWPP